MESNTTEIRYPFHGFYKGLLPSDDNVKQNPDGFA